MAVYNQCLSPKSVLIYIVFILYTHQSPIRKTATKVVAHLLMLTIGPGEQEAQIEATIP
jgi:hypothetical protein